MVWTLLRTGKWCCRRWWHRSDTRDGRQRFVLPHPRGCHCPQRRTAIGEYTSYSVINDSGERLKSSTIPVFGENHRLIGLICINLYLNLPASEFMQSFLSGNSSQPQSETFNSNLTDSISVAVAEAKSQVMHNSTIHSTNKNKEIIHILYDKGIFHIKDSVIQVSEILGISKNTWEIFQIHNTYRSGF